MASIDTCLNEVVRQALICVRYRIAPLRSMRPTGFVHAMGLRYGLLGAAAVAYSTERSHPLDSMRAYEWSSGFRDLVQKEIVANTWPHFPITVRRRHIPQVAEIAQEVLHDALPLPLIPPDPARSLSGAVDRHMARHLREIRREWGFWKAEAGEEEFMAHAIASEAFALAFLNRQRHGLEEVAEIALLGE